MIVRVLLLLRGLVLCGGSRPPRRGAFVPAPDIIVNGSNLIEGDIAVTGTSTENVTTLDSFRTAEDSLWPRGVVYYRIDTDEWNGLVEPVFLDTQIDNITEALQKIENGVPCIEFR